MQLKESRYSWLHLKLHYSWRLPVSGWTICLKSYIPFPYHTYPFFVCQMDFNEFRGTFLTRKIRKLISKRILGHTLIIVFSCFSCIKNQWLDSVLSYLQITSSSSKQYFSRTRPNRPVSFLFHHLFQYRIIFWEWCRYLHEILWYGDDLGSSIG